VDLIVWPYQAAPGARNMALDEAAMHGAGRGEHLLRFYGWTPPCLSLGRNQPTPDRARGPARTPLVLGDDIVRRPTGGRAVYHGPELTYALAVPERFLGGPRRIYTATHAALGTALRALGVEPDRGAAVAGGEGTALDSRGCFAAPAPGEISAGGRKLVGSAQWRHGGAILQHGSLLLRNDQHRAGDDDAAGRRAVGLAELVSPLPELDTLMTAITCALADAYSDALAAPKRFVTAPARPGADVLERAAALERKYRSPEWTWRR
jgi:lipoate-protein ligase A